MKTILTALLTSTLLLACGQKETLTTTQQPETTTTTPQQAADKKLVLYSGRNQKLIGPLLEDFTRRTSIQVETRYGDTAEMAATLLEEGNRTPADVFLSQDAAALGAVSKAGLARPLPEDVVNKVPARFAGPGRQWVGVSGRARVVVYNPKRIRPDQLPQSIEEVAVKAKKGKWGVAPLNASFQSHMATYSALNGEAKLNQLLDAMVKAEPRRYRGNAAVVEAVSKGEIDWGLVNHYYKWELQKENPSLSAENYFMPKGDASSLVNVAGVALLDDDPDALEFVRFLLSPEAQQYFATKTFEYPLVAGVAPPVALQPLDELKTPDIDFSRVSDALPGALAKINERGLSRN